MLSVYFLWNTISGVAVVPKCLRVKQPWHYSSKVFYQFSGASRVAKLVKSKLHSSVTLPCFITCPTLHCYKQPKQISVCVYWIAEQKNYVSCALQIATRVLAVDSTDSTHKLFHLWQSYIYVRMHAYLDHYAPSFLNFYFGEGFSVISKRWDKESRSSLCWK